MKFFLLCKSFGNSDKSSFNESAYSCMLASSKEACILLKELENLKYINTLKETRQNINF